MYSYPNAKSCHVIQPSGLGSCGPNPGIPSGNAPGPADPGRVEVLANELERLEQAIAGLEIRLCPVLRCAGPEDPCARLAEASLDSPLACQVRRLGAIIARIHEITDRVQA